MAVTLDNLRRLAIARSLFAPATLEQAFERVGFVQADPIRAPARAQDLTLRHRVSGYRAGDLERRYGELDIEEDFFINYGFVSRAVYQLMPPRTERHSPWSAARTRRVSAVLNFVRARGSVHPRDVDKQFAHGTVTNYWGGSSNATTHLLESMHYRGLLRIVRREAGIRVYGVREPMQLRLNKSERERHIDRLVDVVVNIYAPLPALSLSSLVSRLRYAVPQWTADLKGALQRARRRLAAARVGTVDWYWPADESADRESDAARVKLLAPFDPVVWDRRRFELFWTWPYRFEAYTPATKRLYGYYALPLLWHDRVIGWGNLNVKGGRLDAAIGYVSGRPPRDREFKRELDLEIDRMREFLGR